MHLPLNTCVVRNWSDADLDSLVAHANNRNVWINLRDRFPFPYTLDAGREYLSQVRGVMPATIWAIEVDHHAVGGIGLVFSNDVERVSAEIGYWLGEPYWRRGIATDALRAVTAEAFRQFDLTRIFALPFSHNIGSIRVLEKAGYVLEGVLRHSAIKEGIVRDQCLYAAYKRR